MKSSNSVWEKIKLGDVLNILTDYHANGSYKKLKENVELLDTLDYAIMIRTTNCEKEDFKNDLKYIKKSAYEFLSKSKVKTNDILMNKIANAGSVYSMPKINKPVSLAMNLFLLRTCQKRTDQKFIFYQLKSKESYIKSFATGTATQTITKNAVRNLEISLPPLPTQRKIARILSAYDDLIENNTRRIEILEEMARMLYREWFVKFRFPVGDGEDGGNGGGDRPSNNRPVELVESELGLIPKGWEVIKLGDVVKVISGYAFKSKDFQEYGIPVIKIKNIRHGDVDFDDIQYVDKSFLSLNRKYHVKLGDLLISLTGSHLTQPNSVVGRVAINFQGYNDSLLNQRAGKILVEDKTKCNIPFLFILLSTEDNKRNIALMASGAASQANISPSQVESLPFVLPPKNIMDKFHDVVHPIFEKIKNLNQKNISLRKTRDLLLPRLISGEIDVEELDINLGAIEP